MGPKEVKYNRTVKIMSIIILIIVTGIITFFVNKESNVILPPIHVILDNPCKVDSIKIK
jgi:hypothetical protein